MFQSKYTISYLIAQDIIINYYWESGKILTHNLVAHHVVLPAHYIHNDNKLE